MKLYSIIAEKFKLDGGACFGTVPKTIWQKQVTVDENNMVGVLSRCLLVEDGNSFRRLESVTNEQINEIRKKEQDARNSALGK